MNTPKPVSARRKPKLGGELLASLALVFAAAVMIAAVGAVILSPFLFTPARAVLFVGSLALADVAVFTVFGHYLLRKRVLDPLEGAVQEVEGIAEGDYGRRLEPADSQEMQRLSDAVNLMAERLITHQQQLAANVRSLQQTNRELTEARDELIRAEKMASVGHLAAGIAHEIGNPLGAILGYLGVLGRSPERPPLDLIAAAESETRRIDRIVHGLLDYARPRGTHPRAVDVNEVVSQTVELLSVQGKLSDVEFSLDLGEALPEVRADWNQLQQVLVNLMINALDAMEDGAVRRLGLSTRRVRFMRRPAPPMRRADDPPDVDYSHRRRFNRQIRVPRDDAFPNAVEVVRIAVSDSGPGIPPEHREHVFDPFFTTKEPGKGTGLGLAVAARLIDAMGGTIRVADADADGDADADVHADADAHAAAEGTTFEILLPRAPVPSNQPLEEAITP